MFKSFSSPSLLHMKPAGEDDGLVNSVDECSQAETMSCQSSPAERIGYQKALAEKKSRESEEVPDSDAKRLVELEKQMRECDFYEGMQQYESKALQALMHATLGLVPKAVAFD
jgi:hypothetical protein